MPSPVRRIAPKPSRRTDISPPNETFPAAFAESSFLFILTSKILPLALSHADRHTFSSFARRGGHEFRPDWVANISARNGVNGVDGAFSKRPADYVPNRRELFRPHATP